MTRKLSVTAACNAANQYVGKPVKFSQTSWQVFFHEPGETASRTMQAGSYSKASVMVVETKALIALELLGESWGYAWSDGPDVCVYTSICDGMNWQKAVKEAHEQAIAQ
jgi:hypothetical protein